MDALAYAINAAQLEAEGTAIVPTTVHVITDQEDKLQEFLEMRRVLHGFCSLIYLITVLCKEALSLLEVGTEAHAVYP